MTAVKSIFTALKINIFLSSGFLLKTIDFGTLLYSVRIKEVFNLYSAYTSYWNDVIVV
jgi:hypothetical protein